MICFCICILSWNSIGLHAMCLDARCTILVRMNARIFNSKSNSLASLNARIIDQYTALSQYHIRFDSIVSQMHKTYQPNLDSDPSTRALWRYGAQHSMANGQQKMRTFVWFYVCITAIFYYGKNLIGSKNMCNSARCNRIFILLLFDW